MAPPRAQRRRDTDPPAPTLRLGWATHKAAEYACKHWHYSGSVPAGKTVKVGVWEDDRFVGVVIYSRGAAPSLGRPYGLENVECCELTRVAMRDHVTAVSRILAISLKLLVQVCPGVRMIVSFADENQGHHGGIYQANGWVYTGRVDTHAYRVHGRIYHPKTLHSRYGLGGQSVKWLRENVDPKAERVNAQAKHRYLKPMDPEIAGRVAKLAQSYPKRGES